MIKKNLVCHNYFLKNMSKNSAKYDTHFYNFNYDSFTYYFNFCFKSTIIFLQGETNF